MSASHITSEIITTQNRQTTFAARAALVVKYGVPVMPLEPQSKKAALKDWPTRATTDANQIAEWNEENPDCNCAAVGRKGGFWILDVDNPTVFDRVEQDTGRRLDEIGTLVTKSSGDKRHHYFKHDAQSEAMGNFSVDSKDGEMFSVRALNSYVVAPGSIHPDTKQPYEVVAEPIRDEIPVAPAWLVSWLISQSKQSGGTKTAAAIPDVIPMHTRNSTLTSLAGSMRRRKASESAILAALRETNNRQCVPPLPDAELVTIAGSVAKYAPAENNQNAFAESGGSPPSPQTKFEEKLNLVPLSSIEAEVQEWLWENRIPKAALTNISGDADKGKSLILYDLLARISVGADLPDGAKNPFDGKPKKVLLLFAEGSLKTTVKPRMMVMGANMDNILAVRSVSRRGETDKEKRQFFLQNDLAKLRQVLEENPEIVLIGFDPITNYLGDHNMYNSQEVRRVLGPLTDLAEECNVTVVSLVHFNKNMAMSAIHRTGGAGALVEVPRAAWCCLDDTDPENKGGFVFLRIKNNLGKRVGGLSYRIEETFIDIKGQRASEPQLVWGTKTDISADDVLGLQSNPEMKGIAKARAWLEEKFNDDYARKSTVVMARAQADGITPDCLKKARQNLRMGTKKMVGQWYMRRHQGVSQPWVISADSEGDAALDSADNPQEAF